MLEPETREFHPESLGFQLSDHEALKGGSAQENAEIALSILRGETGPRRDITLINAAHALLVAGKADDIESCLDAARISIDSGSALAKLNQLIETTILLKAA
jgi:anthranilate phosphoribosyltransferase